MTIRIDYSNMVGEAAGGVGEAAWFAAAQAFRNAH